MKKTFRKSKSILKEPDSTEHGYNYAIFLLGLRLRTSGELKKKMQERGYNEQVVEAVVDQLIREKFLNDDQYAEIYIENMKSYRTYGLFMVKKKLMERRLGSSLIEKKLDELFTLKDELKIAKRFLDKEVGKQEFLSYRDKQKFARKLQSRGFRGEVVQKALNKYPVSDPFREDA